MIGKFEIPSEALSISIIAALAAIIGAIIAGITSHYSNRKRNSFEARVEICKYREKSLSNLKEEIAVIVSQAMLLGVDDNKSKTIVADLMTRRSRILLSVPDTDPVYDELNKCLADISTNMMKSKNAQLGKDTGDLIKIGKQILNTEWEEIQDLLYKERAKKKNAKNQ